jgi:hypothetical protein
MAYNIFRSNGTPVTVPENIIDIQFYTPNFNGPGKGVGTQLVGRNAIDYGSAVAQNFLQLTENFANNAPPPNSTSLIGQLWFDTGTSDLFVKYTSAEAVETANWKKVVTVESSGDVELSGDLDVVGSVFSRGGRTAVVYPADFLGSGLDGDIKVDGDTIFIWAAGEWRQVFPAIYS